MDPTDSGQAPRILVLGLGNDLIADDGIGLLVARAVRDRLGGHASIHVVDCCEMGLSLLDYIEGYQALLVVDSVQTGKVPPGEIHRVGEHDLKTLPGMSPHFLGVGEILALGRVLELEMPRHVHIFAVEADDVQTIGAGLTPPLQKALPIIVDEVLLWLEATLPVIS